MKPPYGKPLVSAQFDATTGGVIDGDTPVFWKKHHEPAQVDDRHRYIKLHSVSMEARHDDNYRS